MSAENPAPDLPPYSLDVQGLDLGSGTEAVGLCLVISEPAVEVLEKLIARFQSETFGLRAGAATRADPALEGELSRRGLDAYEAAYPRYSFCAICEAAEGWVTVLSETLWPSEIIRRVRPVLQPFDVYIVRPQ